MRLWTTAERVAALSDYEILDTPPETAFDDIVDIARALTGAPMALISLVDADRQWFKARRGVGDLAETPLDTSFCALAVDADQDVLLIPDAAADPRTARMSLVIGEPQVRSYAGVLLRSPAGAPLGTVCVLDTVAREFPPQVAASLVALARQVSALLELRRTAAERTGAAATLRDANLGRELAMQAARLGRWDHHPLRGRRYYDARAYEILGAREGSDITVDAMLEMIDPRDRAHVAEALAAVLRPERVGSYDVQYRIGSDARWVSAVGRTLFEDGVCTRFFGVLEDITERKQLEEQRAFLTDELNHRVKNILSLAQSVGDSTLRTAPDLRTARDVLAGRLQALGRAHDVLLQQQWKRAFLRDLATSTLSAAGVDLGRMQLDGPPVELDSHRALQLSLALHELATNAGKYGALSNDVGRVALTWEVAEDGGGAHLRLGWAERGGPPVAPPGRRGFGSRVIGRATESAFAGHVELDYAPAGLRWTLRAPLPGGAAEGA